MGRDFKGSGRASGRGAVEIMQVHVGLCSLCLSIPQGSCPSKAGGQNWAEILNSALCHSWKPPKYEVLWENVQSLFSSDQLEAQCSSVPRLALLFYPHRIIFESK